MAETHARTCHLCEANCGVLIEVEGAEVLSIKGNPDHVLSKGHICPKATALADLQADPDRLRQPVRRDGEAWVEVSWKDALEDIGRRFAALGGKDAALWLGNPNAHNYGLATQMKSLRRALGVRSIYSASTLDQIPHQLVQLWMYGHNGLFPIPDIDRTQFFLMVGANPLASNGSVWTVPGVRKRLKALQARGGRFVVVDPRRTETAALADEHHFIRPGTDPAFFLGLLRALDEFGGIDPGRLEPHLQDFDAARALWMSFELEALAKMCGVSVETFRALARSLAQTQPAIVYGRLGVSTQEWGTLNLWLIQLLNIATGNLDREGGSMFTTPAVDIVASSGTGSYGRFKSRVRGQAECLSEFPAAVLAEEILTPGEGQTKALFTVAGNPVLSSPNGAQVDEALSTLELMVSVDMYVTETTRHAHYILPPCGPLEKDHYPLTFASLATRNYVCYSPPVFDKPEGAKEDWEIVADLAQALAAATDREVPRLPTPRQTIDFGLQSAGKDLSLKRLETEPNGIDLGPLEPRLPERLRTESSKIHCAPPLCLEEAERFREALTTPPVGLTLIGRRHLRSNNSWLHNSERLLKGPDRCTLMIHPEDAAARRVEDGVEVEVKSRVGTVRILAEVTENIMPGTVSIPHGWGHDRKGVQLRVAGRRPGVSINDLTDNERLDPLSGNAAFSGTPVEVRGLH